MEGVIAAPWNLVLTLLFTFTALVCLSSFVNRRRRDPRRSGLDDMDIVDLTHGVMSVAMIVMTWFMVWDAVTWAQVAIFAVFALALVPSFRGAERAKTIDLTGHIALDAAMIWMLVAMPMLMAGAHASGGGGDAHAGHHEAGGVTFEATPVWAEIVNAGFVALSVAAALWWLWRCVRVSEHRIHSLCHAVMGAGMAWMLVLMNA